MSETAYHHGNLREALIDRAVEVLAAKGVEGLSLRSLACDLGVSHAAPARHFASKADLLAAIVRTAYEKMTEVTMVEAEKAGDDPVKRLNLIARTTVRWAIENKGYYTALMNPDVSRFADGDLKAAMHTYIGLISTACVEAQKAGLHADKPLMPVLIYGIAATIGTSPPFTDQLLQEVIGPVEETDIVENIINLVIPVEK